MECLIHSPAFNFVKMAWVAGVGMAKPSELMLRLRVLLLRLTVILAARAWSLRPVAAHPREVSGERSGPVVQARKYFLGY